MQDQLEDFVRKNQDAFNQAVPDSKLWDGVEKAIQEPPKVRKLWKVTKFAAAVLFLLLVGVVVGMYLANQQMSNQQAEYNLPEDYKETQVYYTQKINLSLKKLENYQRDETLEKDLQELDQYEKELKKALKESTNKEPIVQAMIENYQTKIQILERVIERLDRQPVNHKKVKNEGIQL